MYVQIREWKLEDIEHIARIHVKTWQIAYQGIIPQEHLDGLSLSEWTENKTKRFHQKDPRLATLVAVVDGKVVGFSDVGFNRESENASDGQIYTIYLDMEHTNKGIGTQLLQAAEQKLKELGYHRAILNVLDSNEKGIRFYEKNGWKTDNKKKIDTRFGLTLTELEFYKELREK